MDTFPIRAARKPKPTANADQGATADRISRPRGLGPIFKRRLAVLLRRGVLRLLFAFSSCSHRSRGAQVLAEIEEAPKAALRVQSEQSSRPDGHGHRTPCPGATCFCCRLYELPASRPRPRSFAALTGVSASSRRLAAWRLQRLVIRLQARGRRLHGALWRSEGPTLLPRGRGRGGRARPLHGRQGQGREAAWSGSMLCLCGGSSARSTRASVLHRGPAAVAPVQE